MESNLPNAREPVSSRTDVKLRSLWGLRLPTLSFTLHVVTLFHAHGIDWLTYSKHQHL